MVVGGFLAAKSSSRSDVVTQFVRLFVRCPYPYFYFEALEANLDVLPVFYQCFASVSPVFHQCFACVSPVFRMCFASVSPVFRQSSTSVPPVFHTVSSVSY